MRLALLQRCTALALTAALAGCSATPTAPSDRASGSASATMAATGKCDALPDQAYALPAGRFDETAQQLAHATGCMVVYRDPALAPLQVNAVKGRISIRQALHQALDGTALRIAQENPDTLTVVRR
jgi:Secretin and TonB N terminus short domain.